MYEYQGVPNIDPIMPCDMYMTTTTESDTPHPSPPLYPSLLVASDVRVGVLPLPETFTAQQQWGRASLWVNAARLRRTLKISVESGEQNSETEKNPTSLKATNNQSACNMPRAFSALKKTPLGPRTHPLLGIQHNH